MNAKDAAEKLGDATKEGRGWRCKCPLHNGHGLILKDGRRGVLLARCWGGCDKADVLDELRQRGLLNGVGTVNGSATQADESKPLKPMVPVPSDAPPFNWRNPKYGRPTSTFAYRTADGELIGYVARSDFRNAKGEVHKDIRPVMFCRLPNGKRGWRAAGFPEPRPLYGLERLAARPCALVIVCEGEKAADAASRIFPDHVAVTSPHGSKSANKATWDDLRQRDVTVWPDFDASGNTYAVDVARLALAAGATAVRIVAVPPLFPASWDLGDKLPDGVDAAELRRLLEAAPLYCPVDEVQQGPEAGTPAEAAEPAAAPVVLSDEQAAAEIARLAKLSTLQYARARGEAAKRLGITAAMLDKLLKAERGSDGSQPGQGRPLELTEPTPWPDPVDGAALLTDIAAVIGNHVVMSAAAADAVALWVMLSHMLDAAHVAPRLAIKSPEKRCGKSTLLSIIAALVTRALATSNITPAALFRSIEAAAPTLLIDEGDAFVGESDELRGLLNSGHTRALAYVVRTVGDDHEPRRFATWCLIAIAAIGNLPGTIEDRSICINLRRRRPDEPVTRLRQDRLEAFDHLASKAARWARDNLARLAGLDPEAPGALHDRAADNWRGLLAIADAAGGTWPARARAAAVALSSAGGDDAETVGTMLLADVRAAFAERNTDRIAGEDLAAYLVGLDDRPWPEFGRAHRPISKVQIARLLKRFQISSNSIRLSDGRTPKGYRFEQFADAFARYLPAGGFRSATAPRSAESRGLEADSETQQAKFCGVSEYDATRQVSADCGGVADSEPLWGDDL